MRLSTVLCLAWGIVVITRSPVLADEPSVERGLYVSIIGSCHDCHTAGYSSSGGVIDPEKALRGDTLGFQGPWGTSYALNLRLTITGLTEDGFLRMATSLSSNPPMPWHNVRKMKEEDLRSLYRYIASLGEPGKPAPTFVPPGERVNTPYLVLSPPQMPPPCTRDLDCGVGEICLTEEPRRCARR